MKSPTSSNTPFPTMLNLTNYVEFMNTTAKELIDIYSKTEGNMLEIPYLDNLTLIQDNNTLYILSKSFEINTSLKGTGRTIEFTVLGSIYLAELESNTIQTRILNWIRMTLIKFKIIHKCPTCNQPLDNI